MLTKSGLLVMVVYLLYKGWPLLGLIFYRTALFCVGGQESLDHLFVHCPYNSFVLRHLASLVGPNILITFPTWLDLLNAWGNTSNTLHKHILLLIAQVFCYRLWRERNGRMHGKGCSGPFILLDEIVTDVKSRLSSSNWFVNMASNSDSSSWLHS